MGLGILAVTVSIGYGYVLQACLANRKHFSSWTVVSSNDDSETLRLAEAAGLRCIQSNLVAFSHKGFHAAHGKSRFINHGIFESLKSCISSDESWCLIIDADILLPTDFGERLSVLIPFLSGSFIYGVHGRRAVETASEISSIRETEPWLRSGSDQPCVLGSFQDTDAKTHPRTIIKVRPPKNPPFARRIIRGRCVIFPVFDVRLPI